VFFWVAYRFTAATCVNQSSGKIKAIKLKQNQIKFHKTLVFKSIKISHFELKIKNKKYNQKFKNKLP